MPSEAIKVSCTGCGTYKGFHTVQGVSYACFHVAWVQLSTLREQQIYMHIFISPRYSLECCFIVRALLDGDFFVFYECHNSGRKGGKKEGGREDIPQSFLEVSCSSATNGLSQKERKRKFLLLATKMVTAEQIWSKPAREKAQKIQHNGGGSPFAKTSVCTLCSRYPQLTLPAEWKLRWEGTA